MKNLDEDKLIETTFDGEKLSKEKFDSIVIGSGAAGLSSASVLAQNGKKVLLLEASEKLGGFTNSFEEDGHDFATGLHYLPRINESSNNGIMYKILFQKLTEGKLEFVEYDDPYDYLHIDGKREPYSWGGNMNAESLTKLFPDEKEGIVRYFKVVDKIYSERIVITIIRSFPAIIRNLLIWILSTFFGYIYFKYNEMSCEEAANSFFKNEDLKRLTFYMYSMVGEYEKSPAALTLLVVKYFLLGACTVKGSCDNYAKKFARVIVKYGGKVACNAKVTKICVNKNGKVDGVVVKSFEREYRLLADNVVACHGFMNTVSMVPKKYRPKKISKIEMSVGHFFGFLGFDIPFSESGLPRGNIWFLDGKFSEEKDFFDGKKKTPSMIFVSNTNFMKEKGSDKTTMNVILPTKYKMVKRWENTGLNNRGNEYENLKNECLDDVLKKLYDHYPKLEGKLEKCLTGSQLSTKHWVHSTEGASYGIVVDSERLYKTNDEILNKFKIKNLHVSGVDTQIGAGVGCACLSGVISAGEILGRNLMLELANATTKFIIQKERVVNGKKEKDILLEKKE